jgi:rhamnosyltransferase
MGEESQVIGDAVMAAPLVLVLLAARNGAAHIAEQIDSVLRQEGVDVRLVVRDDGSSDDTRSIVEAYASRDGRVRLLPDHEPSGSASANFFRLIQGAHVADVGYVALCDQDDEWLPGKLARAVECLDLQRAAACSAAVQAQWPDGRARVLSQNARSRSADYLFEGAGQGCTFVLRKDLFEQLREILGRHPALQTAIHFHDWALYALARAQGARWYFDPRVAIVYRQHEGNDTGARASGGGVARRLRLIRQGWYRMQVRAIVALVRASDPGNIEAARWARLDEGPDAMTMRGRFARLVFVARHGRRRGVDRCIQAAAVVFGYL